LKGLNVAKELDEYKAGVINRLLNLNEEETEIVKGLYGTPELIIISKIIGPEVTKALADGINSISGNSIERKRGLAAR